jgi:Ser/Thr protein kinase RdoA (MazF antagonist)
VLGHDITSGAVSWVAATCLDGTRPTGPHDDPTTALFGRIAAHLHALPPSGSGDLDPFQRIIQPLAENAGPIGARLTAVLAEIEPHQRDTCVTGFVHGDYSARNLLFAPGRLPGVIDFEGCGTGCVYEDLTTVYIHNCLIEGGDPPLVLTAYEAESARLGRATETDRRHLLFHAARYFRWARHWAPGTDATLTDRINALAPRVLDALEIRGTPAL